jgi:hypothetical protein
VINVARGGVQVALISTDGQIPAVVARRLEPISPDETLATVVHLLDRALREVGLGQGVGCLVQQGTEHVDRPERQAFAADEHLWQRLPPALGLARLVQLGAAAGGVVVPAHRGEMPESQAASGGADRPGREYDDYGGDVWMAAADGVPGVLQRRDHRRGENLARD